MRIIVGITGASGAVYGLELLRALREGEHEVHAIVSPYGWKVLEHECRLGQNEIVSLAEYWHAHDDLTAPVASGSFRADVMAVVPCSMRTLAAIAGGLADNLLCRAADVMLKERKNLVLAVRETPVNAIHLENMLKLSNMGAIILPASPGFYHQPQTIDDLVDFVVARILNLLNIPQGMLPRWGEHHVGGDE